MPKSDILGNFEELVLTTVAVLGSNGEAYGVTIFEKAQELAEPKRVSIGAVYTTLDRLEQKGFLSSTFSEPTKERGGRAKRIFKLEAAGAYALKAAVAMNAGLRQLQADLGVA